jgi:hypothetical protein
MECILNNLGCARGRKVRGCAYLAIAAFLIDTIPSVSTIAESMIVDTPSCISMLVMQERGEAQNATVSFHCKRRREYKKWARGLHLP